MSQRHMAWSPDGVPRGGDLHIQRRLGGHREASASASVLHTLKTHKT